MSNSWRIWRSGKYVSEQLTALSNDVWAEFGGKGIVVQTGAPPADVAVNKTDDDPFGELISWHYPKEFEDLADRNMRMIAQTKTGRTLLDYFSVNKHPLVVVSACAPEVGNMVRSESYDALHLVASEVTTSNKGELKVTQAALKQASEKEELDEISTWLAHRVYNTPMLTWPETYPLRLISEVLGEFDSFKEELPRSLMTWLTGKAPLAMETTKDKAIMAHIKNVTIAVATPLAPPNKGSGAVIGWSIDPTSQANRERPPAVGLAHELVHAYFSVHGQQPGRDDSHWSTILFEYRCVGLGPWDGQAPSENSVRSEWKLVQDLFPGYWLRLDNNDYLYALEKGNHKHPFNKRAFYGSH